MRVDAYERAWMWAAAGIVAVVLGATVYSAVGQGRLPPSRVETIDPRAVRQDPRFSEVGVSRRPDGTVEARLIAGMFAFAPAELRIPARTPVTFRLTSVDVIHGFEIVGTNGNTMVVPGYVSQFSMSFDRPGEYLMLCNEYCGQGHHVMYGKIIVEPAP